MQVVLPRVVIASDCAACMFSEAHAPDPTPSTCGVVSGLGSGACSGNHASGSSERKIVRGHQCSGFVVASVLSGAEVHDSGSDCEDVFSGEP